jgi:hypothetical protein
VFPPLTTLRQVSAANFMRSATQWAFFVFENSI